MAGLRRGGPGYVDLETEACAVRELSLMYLPGLLQTEDYMRTLFRASRIRRTRKEFENQVAVRLIRQGRLSFDEHSLQLVALLDEGALRRPIGGPEVMREQLKHVLRMADLDSVELRVLGVEAAPHMGVDGAFVVLGFPEPADQDLVYVAYPAGSLHMGKGPRSKKLGWCSSTCAR